ncbi:Hpt domain-containing protein [Maricaulis parjimensis]|uniref:Hpt domain-containing protein n=1 Tax=Maricaulis parjimensis TaxID=144023 RepID=UPI00193A371B|nr:Hpt domain-containing protein [Maricaulis parjimensis]
MSEWQDQPELDMAAVSTLVAAVGKPVFDDMKGQFVADLSRLVETYGTAHSGGDDGEARAMAHALKGAASNIGLKRLAALAAELERGNDQHAAELTAVLEGSVRQLEAA